MRKSIVGLQEFPLQMLSCGPNDSYQGLRGLFQEGVDLFAEVALKVFGAVVADVHEACPARAVDDDQAGEFGNRELVDGVLAVHRRGQSITSPFDEDLRPLRSFAVLLYINGPEDHVGIVLIVPIEVFEFGHLATAGRAPRGPVIENDNVAAPVGRTYEATVHPADFERGRWSDRCAGRDSSRERGERGQCYRRERCQGRQNHQELASSGKA